MYNMLCNPAASARSRNHSFFRLGQASFSQVFWLRRITNWCRTIITYSVLLALAYFLAVGIQGYWSALLYLQQLVLRAAWSTEFA